jgi:DNA-binding transcriptional ArsR family regulator
MGGSLSRRASGESRARPAGQPYEGARPVLRIGNAWITVTALLPNGGLIAMPAAEACGDPFEALGDANRREILRLLSGGDKPVHEIAAALPISRPAVSRHLRLLKDAGLVAEQAHGTRRIYHLQQEGLQAVQVYLERVWGEAAVRFRLLAENSGPDARQ